MQPLVWILFDLLIDIFESGMFVSFVFKTLECKVHARYRKLLFIVPALILFGLLTLFRYTNVFEGIALVCLACVTFTLATMFFHGTFIKKALLSILPILFIAVSDAIGLNLTALLFQLSPTHLSASHDLYYVFFVVIAHVLFFLFWYILKSYFNRNRGILTKAEWLFLSVVIAVSVFIFILTVAVIIFIQLYHIGLYSAEDGIQLYIGMTMLFLITMDFTVCFLFVQLSKKRSIMTENTLLRQQYKFGEKS
ncbi:MAG: hypothetical protein IJB27_00305, partial [Clostridia bacterium]|nr:hypothetical protein [Clostridia bacterium]